MVRLESTNLTEAGGPMGSARTWGNWSRYYSTVPLAKAAAEADYGKPLRWEKAPNGWSTGDLGYVMYRITDVVVDA